LASLVTLDTVGVINSISFSPPKDEKAWMARGVLAQQWWVREEGHGILGVSKPNIFSTAAVITSIYTLYAAWRQHPLKTALGTILTVVLNFWWLRHLVDLHDKHVIWK